jgi:hypothetical protein
MLMMLVVALLLVWGVLVFALKVAGWFIHLLVVIAIVALIYRLATARRHPV